MFTHLFFLSFEVYGELECIVHTKTGTGQVVVKLLGDIISEALAQDHTSNSRLEIPLTYVAPSTYDELEFLLLHSTSCQQDVFIDDLACLNSTSWVSLSGDTWHASNFVQLNR